ncbi:ROK family transcriptional regulator [Virgibacillus halophilus]|uniref:ROK family transcriptional regulator n=1 Tax=Tigheibacillus halophilus TaxID=361280 RepID=A0ABU5C6T2_9BACI|nr:ROK family transcriptional regulator [Virgibacillus halophilus]
MERGTFQMMKTVNRTIILNKIRTSKTISRAAIAKLTKLTPPTVSSIVKELIEEGIVQESSLGASSGGRKPMTLLINHDRFYIIGIDAGPITIDGIVTNLSGKIIARESQSLSNVKNNDQFLHTLKSVIVSLLEAVDNTEKVFGIGIAMQGAVDLKTGTALVAPNLGLRDIPIKEELEKNFDIPVKVENDARAMAIGESWFGNDDSYKNIMAINIGRGVGAGIVIDGKLYHGTRDLAGEVGHMTIDINGEVCDCGNKGCLQAYITGPAIVKRILKLEHNESIETGEDVFRLAEAGDTTALRVFQETGRIIGVGLTNLIHVVNPEMIILGGGVMKAEKFILPSVQETIIAHALTENAKSTKVAVTHLGDDATLLGAVALLLVEVFY